MGKDSKSMKLSGALGQESDMHRSYMKLERRNTKFKMTTNINQSEITESIDRANSSALRTTEKDVKNTLVAADVSKVDFEADLVSANQTDPNYKSGKRRFKRSRSTGGSKEENSEKKLATERHKVTQQNSLTRKSGSQIMRRALTQRHANGGGPGDESSPSKSSGSSSLTSSVYSSTISSHLSGDEDQEKHHIQDQFAEEGKSEI